MNLKNLVENLVRESALWRDSMKPRLSFPPQKIVFWDAQGNMLPKFWIFLQMFNFSSINLSSLEMKVILSLRAEKRLERKFSNIFAELLASFIDLEKSVLVLQLIDFETICRRHTSEKAVNQFRRDLSSTSESLRFWDWKKI